MTKNVSYGNLKADGRPKNEEYQTNFGEEIRTINKFLLIFINTVLTVAGSFFFTYKALEYAIPEGGFAFQLLAGCFVGSIVFMADLYFILKSS